MRVPVNPVTSTNTIPMTTQVADAKPKRPFWTSGVQPDSIVTAMAAWGHLMLLGNDDGLLSVWDTNTGRTVGVETNQVDFRAGCVSRLCPQLASIPAREADVTISHIQDSKLTF